MSSSGIITVLVLLLGTACCTLSYSAARDGDKGAKGPGVTAPAVSSADVRALHHRIAQRLRDQGMGEAAAWHERMASDLDGDEAAATPATSDASGDMSHTDFDSRRNFSNSSVELLPGRAVQVRPSRTPDQYLSHVECD